MSTLNDTDTAEVVDFAANALLGSRYGRGDGSVNVNAAARDLGDALASRRPRFASSSLAANRKLLERVIAGKAGRLRLDQAERLVMLVACLDQSTHNEAILLWANMTMFRDWSPDWFGAASHTETRALRLRTWDAAAARRDYIARLHFRALHPPPIWVKEWISTARHLLGATAPLPNPQGANASQSSAFVSGFGVTLAFTTTERRGSEKSIGPIDSRLLAELDAFEEAALNAGHHSDRVELAIRRFLGPFCAWARSDGRCIGWHQISRTDQRHAFKAGLAAERAWLGTAPRIKRKTIVSLEPIRSPKPLHPAVITYRAERTASQRRRRN